MKMIVRIITALLCVGALSSCMADSYLPADTNNDLTQLLEGRVTDQDGNPIEHIRITAEWDTRMPAPDVKYTDSEGKFYIEIISDLSSPVTVTLTIDDIDGEENGGNFKSMSDTITLFEDGNVNATAELDYRLSHATASESSPQS